MAPTRRALLRFLNAFLNLATPEYFKPDDMQQNRSWIESEDRDTAAIRLRIALLAALGRRNGQVACVVPAAMWVHYIGVHRYTGLHKHRSLAGRSRASGNTPRCNHYTHARSPTCFRPHPPGPRACSTRKHELVSFSRKCPVESV